MTERRRFFTQGPGPSATATLSFMLFGLLVWFAHLSVVYAAHTAACLLDNGPTLSALIVAVATAAGLLAVGLHLLRPRAVAALCGLPTDDVGPHLAIARGMSGLATVAILWTGATALMIDACVQGR